MTDVTLQVKLKFLFVVMVGETGGMSFLLKLLTLEQSAPLRIAFFWQVLPCVSISIKKFCGHCHNFDERGSCP